MPNAEINGHPTYFEDSGGSGPPIVLSHGFLMDHAMFDLQVDALKNAFRVITWDERGHGQTPADGPFTYWDSAADVLAILDYLDIERAVLGGMSQGGFLSLRAALTAPERVKALVLIDTQAGTEGPEMIPLLEGMKDEWMANGPGAVQEAAASMILGEGTPWDPWFAKWAAIPRDSLLDPLGCLIGREDITDRLAEITCPVIIFHGDADISISLEKAEILRDGLVGCTDLLVIAGGSHASNLTHPDEVNGPLVTFLRQYA